jgi:thiamine biosynthesis lipoprotein
MQTLKATTIKLMVIIFFTFSIITGCKSQSFEYSKISGFAQGTSYHITYENSAGKNYTNEVESLLHDFNKSLSLWDSTSIISRINKNDTTVIADDWFVNVFKKSAEINRISGGAFDITVGPVVRAWGFSTVPVARHESVYIDSLLQYVGMGKVQLKKRKVIKASLGVQLDMNGLAQGYSTDLVCDFFDNKGVRNYMVEIGGEVRAKGKNGSGKFWRIGIDKPSDDNQQPGDQLQAIIEINNKSVSTSGNYRKFYIENGIKYSHTIDPKTGKPARNTLLSATVVASDCITADALATSFMVLGVEKGKELLQKLNGVEVMFIFSGPQGEYEIFSSKGMSQMVIEMEK